MLLQLSLYHAPLCDASYWWKNCHHTSAMLHSSWCYILHYAASYCKLLVENCHQTSAMVQSFPRCWHVLPELCEKNNCPSSNLNFLYTKVNMYTTRRMGRIVMMMVTMWAMEKIWDQFYISIGSTSVQHYIPRIPCYQISMHVVFSIILKDKHLANLMTFILSKYCQVWLYGIH